MSHFARTFRRLFTTRWFHVLIAALWLGGQVLAVAARPAQALGNASLASAVESDALPQGVAPAANEKPLTAPAASVSLDMPSSVFLGEDFQFTVTFDNTGDQPGYGPFVDLIFPVTGQDGDDGVDFLGATYLGADVESVVQTFPDDGSGTGCVSHPWLRDNTGAYVQVCGKAGDKLVSLELPFGSFVPDQPAVNITVKAHLSDLADISPALTIKARGGYMYGATPEDDWCCGDTPIAQPSSNDGTGWPSGDVTPVVMTAEKAFTGKDNVSPEIPSGETPAERYIISADVATGQTITDLRIQDPLPKTVQYISYTVNGATVKTANALPSTSTPGGTFDITLDDVTGVDGNDVTVEIYYYIPRLDADGNPTIDPNTGVAQNTDNSATVTGTWTPKDSRDGDTPESITVGPFGVLQKSLQIQKSVRDLTDATYSPKDVVEYTLDFQVSDFFAFDQVVVTDTLSDGQHFDPSFTPTLEINGNTYALSPAAGFGSSNYDVLCNYTGGPGSECTAADSSIAAGSTKLVFRVSQEIIDRALDANGRLVGGCVDPVNGSNPPDCGTYNDGKTEGHIVFRAKIQDQFTDDYPSGDPSVDQGDKLDDQATISARLLNTVDFTPTGSTVTDDATAGFTIGRGELTKAVYAINGSTTLPTDANGNVIIKPGDEVTYRLTYTLPSSDIENLSFDDYFPLPVFHVDDPDQDGTAGPAWSFSAAGGIPAPGVVTLGPSDTFYQYMTDGLNNGTGNLTASQHNTTPTQEPVVVSNTAANSIAIYYADYDDTRDQSTTVDLLFTVVVSADPFADGLFLTNQAHAYEGSTNAADSTANGIVQVKLTEPVLTSKKGVVWTSNPNATFTQAEGPAGVTFTAPGNSPRWNGTISASGLDANPINADVSGVDAGDTVTFAITIRNTGSSLKGAFDIQLRDVLDSNYYQIPTNSTGLNLQIYYGDGSGPISYTGLGGGPDGTDGTADDLFGNGIELQDPVEEGVCQAHDPNSNNDVIIITYDLTVKPDVHPTNEGINTAHLMHYAGAEGGPNHLAEDITDTASATVLANFTKTLVNTEVVTADNGSGDVVIGELVTYKLTAVVPEGEIPNARLVDTLDDGLAYVGCTSVTAYSGNAVTSDVTTDLASGSDFSGVCSNNVTVANDGHNLTFDLGNITNANRDNDKLETIKVIYQAVVLNVGGNQSGTLLNNSASFLMDEGNGDVTLGGGSAPTVSVKEPTLTLSKSADPTATDAGNTVTYTLTVTNGSASGDTTAYDVVLSDSVPAGMNYVSGSFGVVSGSCDVAPTSTSDTNGSLEARWDAFPANSSCQLTFQATVDYGVAPGQSIENTAHLTWTSLSGDQTAPRSTYNTASTERTGADGVGGALNDYAADSSATVTIRNVAPDKYQKGTSESHTSGANLAIGEIVRYRLVVALPEGTSKNFQIHDSLPEGVTFLNDNTAKAAFVSNGTGIASTGTGVAPAITDTDCFLTGNSADGTTPAIPDTCSPLADGNVSAPAAVTQDDNTFDTGTDVYFRLGDLENHDSDSDTEYVIVEFNALVDNSSTANNTAGDTLTNNFTVWIDGTQNDGASNDVTVTVVEPHITVDKNVVTAATDAGDPMVYRISITNDASGADAAAAFDLSLTDTLSSYLNLNGVTIYTDGTNGSTTLAGSCGDTLQTVTDNSGTGTGATARVDITCLNPGEKVVVDINATVVNDVPAGVTIANTANGEGSSLPGAGTPNGSGSNDTGSTTPGASGTTTGERTYSDSSATSTVLARPTIDKSVASTQYTIGDQITFNLLVTLPEGVTQDLEIFDDLPTGLEYVSHSIITTAAASGGLLAADFNGSLPAPTVTAPGGSGGDVTLTFGDTTTDADNDTTNNAFVVQIVARVLNVTDNQDGDNKDNTAEVRWTNPDTNTTDSASDTASLSIVEPRITTTKSVSPASGVQAGDTLTYTIKFENTGHSEAYDVTAEDTLAQGVSYNSNSASCTDGSNNVPVSVSVNGNTLSFDGVPAGAWDIPAGDYIECTYTVTAQDSLYVDGDHTNTVDADWSSQDGTPSAPDVERVYDDTTTYNFDGTQDTASAAFQVAAPTLQKDDGGVSQTLIGDTIHFTLTITSPKGTLRDAVVTDHLPEGLTYVSGSQQDNGALSTTPTFTVTNNADGTTTLKWDYGATPVAQSSPLTIEYDAVVANVASNQDLTTLTNDAYLNYTNAAGSDQQLHDSESSQVTEASLTIDKSVSVISPQIDAGGRVNYTITIENPNDGSSHATAYDVHFADDLPSQVTLETASVSVSGGTVEANNTSGNKVDVTISDIAVGGSVTITYSATLNTSVTPQQLIENTGDLDWTSQPGSNANERTGADGAGGLNDYAVSDTASFTSDDATALDKLTPSPTQYTIGQEVTFDLVVTLNEGTTPSLVVTDDLPNGLEYVSHSIVTSGAPLTKAFSDPAEVNNPTVTVTSGDGGGITLDFGDVTVTGNNDTDDNSFVVRVVARVVNDNTYKSGDTLTNHATLQYTNGQGNAQTLTDSESITLVEPQITTTKSVSSSSGVQAGDTLTYTLQFSNTGNSTAYDVTADDALPNGVTYTTGSVACQDDGGNTVPATVTASGQNLHFDGSPAGAWDIPANGYIECHYTATANSDIPLGGSFTNTADADWSSLDGTVNGERIYNDTAGTPQDGTQDEASATFTTDQPSTVDKDDGGVTQTMIGDTIHVTIRVSSPTGQLANTVVTDVLPEGMKYLAGSQSISGISAATFTISGPNDGTASTTLTWDFGTATVSSSPFTISYDAVATNTSGNVDGTNLVNDVTFSYDDADGTTHTLTDSDDTTIVEAALTVDKLISSIDATQDAGDTVTYRVTITNPNASSNAPAYDVHFADTLPAAVALDTTSVSVTLNGGATGMTNNSSGNDVDVTIDNVPLDASVVIEYKATLQNSVTPSELIANTAHTTWTSQPGANADERTGSDGAGGLNDYVASDTASFNVHDPYYSKSLESTSEASTLDPNVTIGEVLTFVLNVTLPEGTTPSLHIVDNLPDGLEYVVGSVQVDTTGFNGTVPAPTVAPSGSASSGQDITIDFGQITVASDNDDTNNTFKVHFQAVLVDESGNQNGNTLTNNATMQIGNGAPVTTNDVAVNVVEPDLSVTKAVSNATPAYGETLNYTLTVAHTSDSTADAFDVEVTDVIPVGLTYVTGSATTPTGWVVSYNAATHTLTWKGDLSRATGSVQLTYQAKVDGPPAPPNIGDTLSNTAQATWTSLLGSDANERTGAGDVDDYASDATADVTVTAPNLTLSKDDGGVSSAAGQVIVYHLNYANTGNVEATGVTITETVPANATFNAASSTTGWSCLDGATAGTVCTFSVGTVAAGASGTVDFAVHVDDPLPAGVGQVSNTAVIADDGTHGPESTTDDNTASDTTPVAAAPDLQITKTDGVEVVAAGSQLTYTLTATNVGTQHATNVVITDTIPDHTTFVSASNGGIYDDTTRTVTWPTLDHLNVGEAVTYTVTVTVGDPLAAGATAITNRAEVQDDGANGSDLDPADNVAVDVDSVTTGSKSYQGSNQAFTTDPDAAIGEFLTYEVTLTVPAGRTLSNVTLTDVLGRGLAFVSCESVDLDGVISTAGNAVALCNDPTNPTVSAYPTGSAAAEDQGREVVWHFGDLTNGSATDATVTVRYQVVVLDSAENQSGVLLNNQAVWQWTGGEVSGSATPVTVREPDLAIKKFASPRVVLPGEPITFTLEIAHTAESETNAYDVVVTDELPYKLRYVDASLTVVDGPTPTSMAYDATTHTITVTWDEFPLGSTARIRFQATLHTSRGHSATNTASVAWSSLPGDVSAPQSNYNTLSHERQYDPLSPVDVYSHEDSISVMMALPDTGFAPGRVTTLPEQKVAYDKLDGLILEIPKLGVRVPIVGVPRDDKGWNLTWLWDEAGWLEGTAFPTWEGNTALTGHVYLPDGEPGPFVHLYDLRWGDQVFIDADGKRYVYEVRDVRLVEPNDASVLGHKNRDWVTLITCKGYDEAKGSYDYRVVVQAVLMKVEPEP